MQKIYKLLLLLAAPAAVWTSFEMYGLTLIYGPQMLFYSVVHNSPLIYVVVAISAFIFVLLAVFNLALIFGDRLDLQKFIRKRTIVYILGFQLIHALTLFKYDLWANNSICRPLISTLGLLLIGSVATLSFRGVLSPNKKIQSG